jgi:hypothetical protein
MDRYCKRCDADAARYCMCMVCHREFCSECSESHFNYVCPECLEKRLAEIEEEERATEA